MSGRAEAEALAARIRAYWAARGKSPTVWVVQEYAIASLTDDRLHWVVRSDMVGGWPMAGPLPVLRFHSGAKSDSANALAQFSRVPHARMSIESHGPSNRVWREIGRSYG